MPETFGLAQNFIKNKVKHGFALEPRQAALLSYCNFSSYISRLVFLLFVVDTTLLI